jgi:rhamnose transport system permease protein
MEPDALFVAPRSEEMPAEPAGLSPGGQAAAPGGPTRPAMRGRGRSGYSNLARWESGLVVALVATVVMAVSLSPEFLTRANILNLGLTNGEVAIMALPMMLVIIAGEIDLSIQSTLALSSSLLGYLWAHGWAMPLIIAVVLVLGTLLGVFNGLLVTRLGLPSLAVTIGTLTLYAGIAEIILGSNTISNFPAGYTTIGVSPFPHTDLSYSAVIFIVLAIVFGFVLHFTPFGRAVFAIGANKEAALYAGIRVKRIKTALFALSGFIGALAGVLLTFELSTAEPGNGDGFVLSVVAIVLLGGVSIFGGKGSMVGVVLAVLIFAGLQNALLLTNFPESASGTIPGGLLLVAVLVPYTGELLRRGRRMAARRLATGSPEGRR